MPYFCDQCGLFPIVHVRFNCTTCGTYDQCEACHTKSEHDATHVFQEVSEAPPVVSNPDDVAFVDSIAKSISAMFSNLPVESMVLVDADFFAHFVVGHTYASTDDDMACIASTLRDVKQLGPHCGRCFNNTGDVRLGHCKRCDMEEVAFSIFCGMQWFTCPLELLLAICLAHERGPRTPLGWLAQASEHWEKLAESDRTGYVVRAKSVMEHLKAMTWPLVL